MRTICLPWVQQPFFAGAISSVTRSASAPSIWLIVQYIARPPYSAASSIIFERSA